jgi:hypothetical protein
MGDDIEPRRDEAQRFEARFAAVDRTPVLAVVLVAAFVGLAILKPWVVDVPSSTGTGDGTGSAAAEATSAAIAQRPRAATPAPTPTGEAVMSLCLDPGSWRTATIETWRDQTVRVWRAIDPVSASGPLDPTIPIVPAVGISIPAIGYCAPTSGAQQPIGAARVRAWRRDGDAARPVELRQIAPPRVVSPYGALFGPPSNLGSTQSWPNGIFVFRYEELGTGGQRWFAIEVSGTIADVLAVPPITAPPAPLS